MWRLCPRALAWAGAALWCSCVTAAGPERVASRYAEALRDGRVLEAYAMLDERTRPDAAAYQQRYATEAARKARAEAILGSLGQLRASAPAGEVDLVQAGDGGWRVTEAPPDAAPREALERFLTAVEAGDFQAAYLLLAPAWRQRYTPARLEKDFQLEPLAKERLARVRAALGNPVAVSADGAQLPLGDGRAVRLVKEGGGYTIAALE